MPCEHTQEPTCLSCVLVSFFKNDLSKIQSRLQLFWQRPDFSQCDFIPNALKQLSQLTLLNQINLLQLGLQFFFSNCIVSLPPLQTQNEFHQLISMLFCRKYLSFYTEENKLLLQNLTQFQTQIYQEVEFQESKVENVCFVMNQLNKIKKLQFNLNYLSQISQMQKDFKKVFEIQISLHKFNLSQVLTQGSFEFQKIYLKNAALRNWIFESKDQQTEVILLFIYVFELSKEEELYLCSLLKQTYLVAFIEDTKEILNSVQNVFKHLQTVQETVLKLQYCIGYPVEKLFNIDPAQLNDIQLKDIDDVVEFYENSAKDSNCVQFVLSQLNSLDIQMDEKVIILLSTIQTNVEHFLVLSQVLKKVFNFDETEMQIHQILIITQNNKQLIVKTSAFIICSCLIVWDLSEQLIHILSQTEENLLYYLLGSLIQFIKSNNTIYIQIIEQILPFISVQNVQKFFFSIPNFPFNEFIIGFCDQQVLEKKNLENLNKNQLFQLLLHFKNQQNQTLVLDKMETLEGIFPPVVQVSLLNLPPHPLTFKLIMFQKCLNDDEQKILEQYVSDNKCQQWLLNFFKNKLQTTKKLFEVQRLTDINISGDFLDSIQDMQRIYQYIKVNRLRLYFCDRIQTQISSSQYLKEISNSVDLFGLLRIKQDEDLNFWPQLIADILCIKNTNQ